jgi:hypothetical protein
VAVTSWRPELIRIFGSAEKSTTSRERLARVVLDPEMRVAGPGIRVTAERLGII